MSQHDNEEDEQPKARARLNLTTSQVAASALAACCASIVASYLGVAGTVIGAAVGSVVATTGAAIYGHLFRTGSRKLKQTLLINGELVSIDGEAVETEDSQAEESRPAVPAGRFYGAEKNAATEAAGLWHPKTPTAETQVISDETKLIPSSTTARVNPRILRIKKYRKPVGITAAIMAVFAVSIIVGIFAGAPVRSAGSSSNPATTTTTTTTVTDQTHGQAGASTSAGSTASRNPSGTASPSGSSSTSTTPSSSATPSSTASPGASSTAGSTANGAAPTQSQAKANGATNTGSPAA
jgi:hypothetical protein